MRLTDELHRRFCLTVERYLSDIPPSRALFERFEAEPELKEAWWTGCLIGQIIAFFEAFEVAMEAHST